MAAPAERPLPLAAFGPCEALPDGRLACESFGVTVAARALLFPPVANWDAVADTRRRLTLAHSDQDITFDVPAPGGGAWRARQPRQEPGTTAVASWLDGRIVGDGVRSRATQALHALKGGAPGGGGPVLAVLEIRPAEPGAASDGMRERQLVRDLVAAQGREIGAKAGALSLAR
jgi:hypothetical protein